MLPQTICEFLKRVELQPLQYLAAVRVAISVCETENIQQMIRRFRKANGRDGNIGFLDDQWKRLRVQVRRKLTKIGVPDLIIDIIMESVPPVSLEISKWVLYHVDDTGFDGSSNFCWTQQVTIDYEETAKILVKNEASSVRKRFILACFYCLEFEVRSLWERMSLPERRSFFVRGNLKKPKMNRIVLYWSYYIQEVPIDYWGSKALNYTQLLVYAVKNGYLSATKFFLGKLQPNMRKRMVLNCLRSHLPTRPKGMVKDQSAVACFLVCQLANVEILYVLGLTWVFQYFLEWPLQKYFMTVVHRLRDYLYDWIFDHLLLRIFSKISGGFEDYDYKKIFVEFWHLCPEQVKRNVRGSIYAYRVFMKFVKKHFGFVFEENSFTAKAKFRAVVFQEEIPENAKDFDKTDVEFFVFLVREQIPTKATIENFSRGIRYFPHPDDEIQFSKLPDMYLMYLIDGILERNQIDPINHEL